MTTEPPSNARAINPRYCTDRLRLDYAHVGLLDCLDSTIWIARKRFGTSPVRVSHARLLMGGTQDTSTADKDRFLCYWFHTPNSGSGFVHGYPIEWEEAHLLVRLDPNWDYVGQSLIGPSDARRQERSVEQQFAWGKRIFQAYADAQPKFPLSWHMIGPRAADSMFYMERIE